MVNPKQRKRPLEMTGEALRDLGDRQHENRLNRLQEPTMIVTALRRLSVPGVDKPIVEVGQQVTLRASVAARMIELGHAEEV